MKPNEWPSTPNHQDLYCITIDDSFYNASLVDRNTLLPSSMFKDEYDETDPWVSIRLDKTPIHVYLRESAIECMVKIGSRSRFEPVPDPYSVWPRLLTKEVNILPALSEDGQNWINIQTLDDQSYVGYLIPSLVSIPNQQDLHVGISNNPGNEFVFIPRTFIQNMGIAGINTNDIQKIREELQPSIISAETSSTLH